MQTLLMTSTLDCCYKDENGVRIPKNFGNKMKFWIVLKTILKSKKTLFLLLVRQKTTKRQICIHL